MNTKLLSVTLACFAASAISVVACSSENTTTLSVEASPDSQIGSIRLKLLGDSPSGESYQLRDGVFTITGRDTGFTTSVSTETDPNSSSLLVELPVDVYDVFLEPGFRLNLLDEGQALQIRRAASTRKFPRAAATSPIRVNADAGVEVDAGVPPEFTAELVSDNPAQAEILEDAITSLDFVFEVNGETVSFGTGALDIGLQIVQADAGPPGVECTDDFEPNDTRETAAQLDPAVDVFATLCGSDNDFYAFTPNAAVGEAFSVTATFSHAEGDLDAFLINSIGEVVAFGESVDDNERLSATADGNPFVLQTFLFLSPPSTLSYGIGHSSSGTPPIDPPPPVGSGECCSATETPGCGDEGIEACVCAIDDFCCTSSFDGACVEAAIEQCSAVCQ